jgi:hypothetical protein
LHAGYRLSATYKEADARILIDGQITVPVRKALLYYFQKWLRIDAIGTLNGAHETPIVISNRAQFAHALSEAPG